MADKEQDVAPAGQIQNGNARFQAHSPLGLHACAQYLKDRVPTLKPPMNKVPNPFGTLVLLNRQQWLFFWVAFIGMTLDSLDFFTVSLTTSELSESFNKPVSDITWGITLVLMLRTVGAIIFGIASDRWGRKWPYITNNLMFIAVEIATGFTTTYQEFLGVRALFGIAMGGMFGNVAATALEDCPKEARGIVSGLLQQGYAFGYLLATAFSRATVGTTPHGWRPLYWFTGALPVIAIVFRLFLPETNTFIERQALRKEMPSSAASTFFNEGKVAVKRHWMILIYLVLILAGFNFMSHGSQDIYPTLIERQFGFSKNAVTVTQVVANLGALAGGTCGGWASQIFGRRFSIIVMSIVGGALLYPYTFIPNKRIMAAAFFEQFCVQAAWGVIPIHMMELSPGSIRTFTVGVAYQLGNLVASASSTIETTIGERFPLSPVGGEKRYDYGKVICIFMGCVYAYTIVITFLGIERLGRDFDLEADEDVEEIRAENGDERALDVEKGQE